MRLTGWLATTAIALAPAWSFAEDKAAVVDTYADIAEAAYGDSLAAAQRLAAAIDTLIAEPSAEALAAARARWLESRVPYQQTEVYRFGNVIVDEWEGRVNAWPLDEGLIDYVDPGTGGATDENPYAALDVIANPKITLSGGEVDATEITPALLQDTLQEADAIEANVATGYHAVEFLLCDIEREAAASQELYVVLLTRLNEIAAQKEAIRPDARILNAAVPPETPAGPRRGLLAGLAGVLGFAGFTAFVLASDSLSGRFESLGDLEEAAGLSVLGAVRRGAGEGPSRRLVDRDIGPLPTEDGIELAIALRGAGALPRLVVLVPATDVSDAGELALRLVASADRRDRSVEAILLDPEPGPEPGAEAPSPLLRIMPLAAQMAAEADGGAAASARIRASCGHCDAVLLILPAVAETAFVAAWSRHADSTMIVVGGAKPAEAPVIRTAARLRDAGIAPAGIVVVAD